jgi:hypothetical protein
MVRRAGGGSEVAAPAPNVDALQHQRLAATAIAHMEGLPVGAVISIQGSWGRGKTDVLACAHTILAARSATDNQPEPLWLNPWQYGTPDLIRPVALSCSLASNLISVPAVRSAARHGR